MKIFKPILAATSIRYLLLIVLSFIVIGEIIAMLMLELLPSMPLWTTVLLDTVMLSLFIFPILYLVIFRPVASLISSSKRAEEEILNSHSILNSAMESTVDGILVADGKGGIVWLNKKFKEMWSIPQAILDTKNDDTAISFVLNQLKDPEMFVKNVRELYSTPDKISFDVLKLRDGRVFERYSQPHRMDDIVIGRVWSFRDVTERNKAEEMRKIFEQTIRSSNGNINIADLNDKILFVNPAFCKTYGYSEQELIGKDSSIFWSDRNAKEVTEQILPATLQGGWKGELFNKRKDGTEFPIYLSTSVIKNVAGVQTAVVGIVEDITERKRTELERKVIYEIAHGVTTTSNLNELLTLIHHALKNVIYAENCFVALHDRNSGLFSFPYFVDKFDPTPEPVAMQKSCTAYVFRTGKPFLLTQELFEHLVKENEVELVGTNSPSWLGVPLITPSGIIGVLVVQHYEVENVYTERDIQFLESVGFQIAIAIERKWAEEGLREREEMFRKLFYESADPIMLLDESGFINCNPAAVSLFRYNSKEEILHKKPWEISPDHQPDTLLSSVKAQQMVATARAEGYHRFEWVHRTSDGSDFPAEVMLSPVVLKGKQFLYCVVRDITERKHAEELLTANELKFRTLADFTFDWEYWKNETNQILYMSPSCERITGYTSEEFISDPSLVARIVHPDDADTMVHHFNEVHSAEHRKDVDDVEYRIVNKNGSLVNIQHICRPIYDEKNNYLGRRVSNRDITERKKIEHEREELITELQNALEQIKTLRGIVPICSHCKKIRDDKGYWEQVDAYVSKHSEAQFSHSICPNCAKEYFPDLFKDKKNTLQ